MIYARFSTDLQSERSVDDQIELCRAFAQKQGWQIVGSFHDKAKSGATIHGRVGMQDMIACMPNRSFDIILSEAFDRMSRDLADFADLKKKAAFCDVTLYSVTEGAIDTMKAAMYGMMGEVYRENNVHKVRRGMSGRVRDGLSAGGEPYGYRHDPIHKGRRIIVEEEAAVILRIFREYVAGRSPRAIAKDLNRDCIRPPRGTTWNASAINGNEKRGYGILHNRCYIGELVWNKNRMVKDPTTGKRLIRPNSQDQIQITKVPEWRIVPDDLFEEAQARKASRKPLRLHFSKRPKRPLSGLLRCASCGRGMSAAGQDKSGRTRIRCSSARENGSCPDPQSVYLDTVEKLVFDTLAKELERPELLHAYVKEYHEERQRLNKDRLSRRAEIEKRLTTAQEEMDRLLQAIAKGTMTLDEIDPLAKAARATKATAQAELAACDEPENVISLHPQAIDLYLLELHALSKTLGKAIGPEDAQAAQALQQLIERVTVARDPKQNGGVTVVIRFRLDVLLGAPRSVHSMVAEEGFEPPTQGL
ncbi:recombinase family protein [Sinorhizobium fredii]|uniref:recombinase family protein n=1 Tax=Rhizobium fredii TaxID=380 RepID=UPI003BB4DEBD